MPNHFSSIGLDFDSRQALMDMAQAAFDQATPVCSTGNRLRVWRDESGAELWFGLDAQGCPTTLTPSFAATTPYKMGIIRQSQHKGVTRNHIYCDPCLSPEDGDTRLQFDCVNAAAFPNLKVPCFAQGSITGFAHQITIFEDDAHFSRSPRGRRVGARSFFPNMKGRAEAFFNGHIRATERLVNQWTGKPFHRMVIATFGGNIEVVADPMQLEQPPEIGAVASGIFWLCGRLTQIN